MSFINYFKKKTLIIVPKVCLLEQWVELLTNNFKNSNITTFYGKNKDITGDIVVAIVNTICLQEINTILDIQDRFGLVILDEVHMYATKSFKKIYTRINFDYMIGLSATPLLKKSSFDKLSIDYIGEIIDANEIENYEKADNKFNSKVLIAYYNGKEEFTQTIVNEKTGMIDTISMITNLISDPYRNQMIVKFICKLNKLKHNILSLIHI
jgi:superfamily II DNA or RNA helicase